VPAGAGGVRELPQAMNSAPSPSTSNAAVDVARSRLI